MGKKKRAEGDAPAFDQKTIQEFKEAFSIMDDNKDGTIDKNDLKACYTSIGQTVGDGQLQSMVDEAGGNCNFTKFLTMMSEKLGGGSDTYDVLVGAFELYDKRKTGFLAEDQLKKILANKRGDPLDDEDVQAMYKGNPPIKDGQVDYKAFARLITTGDASEAPAK